MSDFCYQDIKALTVALPEEIEKKKWFGDFEGAIHLIDLWLERDIPRMLRAKLQLEREILQVLPLEYIMNYEEALAALRRKVPDLTEAEFADLKDHGKIDWIYVNGKERYLDDIVDTLLKVNPSIKERAAKLDPSIGQPDEEKKALLEVIRQVQRQKSVAYHFRIKAGVRISDEAFHPGHVRVHIPVPCMCKQVQEMKILSASNREYYLSDENAPQRTICFEEDMTENHPFYVEYEYVNRVNYIEVDPQKVEPIVPSGFADELAEKLPHIQFTPYMRSLAAKLTEGIRNPYLKAKSIYDYITTHVEYSFVRNYLSIENLAEYAALGLKGDCGIQALMFITLCRISGIPARWQSGLYTTPLDAGMHDWAQFYIEPYGWLFADCSFGGSAYRDGDEARRQFYFGNLDPFRMPANSDFQEELIPPKKYLRADPYDNQRGEVEFEDKGLHFHEFKASYEVLESHMES